MVNTSWQPVHHWYDSAVGEQGHYYHQHVVIPGVLRLLNLDHSSHLVDLACGQGVLARHLPKQIQYLGLDSSSSLIKSAITQDKNPLHKYQIADITKPIPQVFPIFTHATIILALQNIADPQSVFTNASRILKSSGKLVIVINHPAFRIPRQSSWETDPQNHLQYRRINRYLSPLKIPITTHPGTESSPLTWSFHIPISAYFSYLKQSGFLVETLEEWTSDKQSVGAAAKAENRARNEFPLFLAISAIKR
jgi:ubiquinone/menaquinone biosynthesis C-methylase UbiE